MNHTYRGNRYNWMLVGLGASLAVWLSSKPNRIKTKSMMKDAKRKFMPSKIERSKALPVDKGGVPDPYDTDDNKMVDEGSQYSVNYYNERKQ
jgi:hypothetical protein